MRFTKTELLNYISATTLADVNTTLLQQLPSGSGLTMEQMRIGLGNVFSTALNGVAEGFRQLTNVSNAEAVLYQLNGDQPSGQFEMTLLQPGEAGGIVINGEQTGYKLIPIITGAPSGGAVINSDLFDGVAELRQASTNPDTLRIDHDGQIYISASCLAEPSVQNNKQIEIDICVYNSAGVATSLIGFRSTSNVGSDGRASTSIIPPVMLQDSSTIPAGSSIGLVIRKSALEPSDFTVTMLRSFVLASYTGLAKT
ncbi:MAG: hypothetical protein GY918_08965 [Gammaproteobacteria bacterium]|nr:hypothetical protein [Gammaproteobacteria bacterium]